MKLNEAKEILKQNGYLFESITKPNCVENLAEILLYTFGMENASDKVKSTMPGVKTWVLDDDVHDVCVICEYHIEQDTLEVQFNYGNFSDVFKNLSEHVSIDEEGKITIDQELDNWATDVMVEWTDAFGD